MLTRGIAYVMFDLTPPGPVRNDNEVHGDIRSLHVYDPSHQLKSLSMNAPAKCINANVSKS